MSSRVCRRAVPFLCTGNEGERRKLRKVLAVVHLRMITKTTCAISFHSWRTCFTYLSECRRCTQTSTRLLVVLLSSGGPWVYCNMGEGYIGFRANFASTQRWVLNDTKRGVYNKFLHKHFPITYWLLHPRLTSIRSWLPHALKKTSKLTESWRICSRSLECIHQSMKTRRTIPVKVTLIHWRKPRWSRLRIWRLW